MTIADTVGAGRRGDRTVAVLTWLFFLSGAAGLIYESIWARYLGLFAGHDAYGQIIVLIIFLGGMSLGAAAVSRFTTRIASPLIGYALVELLVGGIGFWFHDLYLSVTEHAYLALYPAVAGTWKLAAVKWGIAGGLILPQSVLLGATFPLMTAGAIRLSRLPSGRILGQLYFANSLGAAIGVLGAGFYLVGRVGLPGTLRVAAGLNLLVGLATLAVAALVRRRQLPAEPQVLTPPAAVGGALPRGGAGLRWLLLTVTFWTAVASFIYEIDWIRMLSLVLGSATHSFELMLSAFILGLALGSLWIRSRADRITDPLRALGIIQWLMGLLALATLPIYAQSFTWTSRLLQMFASTDPGYSGYTVSRYLICLAVMFPATFLAGMTLPLITRTLMASGDGERAVGAVYAVNTLGSIVGVALGGLVLLPWIGLKAMLLVGATLDMGLGVFLLFRGHAAGRRLGFALAAATALVVLGGSQFIQLHKGVLVSGVYRRGRPGVPDNTVVFYRDGRTATVSAVRVPDAAMIYIATNGKSDASLTRDWFVPCYETSQRVPLGGDAATQTLSALIALAHAPGARTAAVVGHGSGITSHHLLASQRLARLTTIEIEPEMIAGSRVFYPYNRRVFDDSRSELIIDDAKSYFASQQKRYDLIVSEPSNPWVSGVSGLFTTEFYARIRRYLSEDGVFAQWLHLYELDDELALRVLAAIHRTFPTYEIFLTTASDMLIIAGNRPQLREPDWSVFSLPGIQQDLCRFVPMTPAALEATRLAGRGLLAPLLDSVVPPNSDFHPALDVGAERRRYLGRNATGLQGLSTERFSIAGLLEGRRRGLPDDPRLPALSIPRLQANSVAAQVRADRAGTAVDDSQAAEAAQAIFRWRLWREALSATAPPSSWRVWLGMFAEIEGIVSGGAQGVADEEFYRAARRYLERHHAPPPVHAAVSFYHGLAAWDFQEAAQAAERLLPEFRHRRFWIRPDDLRDGAVIANLKLNDVPRARRLFRLLARVSERPADGFQSQLIEMHLRRAGTRQD